MRIVRKVLGKLLAACRRLFYRFLSNAKMEGKPLGDSPILAQGAGKVVFGKNVHVGLDYDAEFWTSYVFLNPRGKNSRIEIGKNSWVGNRFSAISEGPGIFIGDDVLIGTRVEILDSDFHAVNVRDRLRSDAKRAPVKIGNRVWIGNGVTILKGTELGEHSVVAAGAVVSGKFPPKSVVGGVPAKIIRMVEFEKNEESR